MSGKSYTQEQKAGALADLLAGATVTSVALKHGISRNTVASWRAQDTELSPRWKEDIQEDLGQCILQHLQEQFAAQRHIMEMFGDNEWLQQQSSRDLAVAYGIISDKQVRILASAAPSPEPEQTD